mmetsp:Transcript_4506/g.8775  ORF Transcript_4506/g.8775 Transcript_4506/m.8775 type:complete len:99 (+) Transcript_4506:103-399(+)
MNPDDFHMLRRRGCHQPRLSHAPLFLAFHNPHAGIVSLYELAQFPAPVVLGLGRQRMPILFLFLRQLRQRHAPVTERPQQPHRAPFEFFEHSGGRGGR